LHAVDIDLDSKGAPWQPVHGLISIRRLIFQHWRLYDRTPAYIAAKNCRIEKAPD
jgi:hypothetical protein